MSINSVNSLSQQLLQSSFGASTLDHYLALLAQRIVTLEQQVARTAAGSARATAPGRRRRRGPRSRTPAARRR